MKIKTITLTGEETKIEFDKNYAFIEINNLSKNEILVSTKPEIVRGNDDVIIVSAKTIATVGDTGYAGIKEIYASGEGEIQLIAKNYAEHCFKLPASGENSDEPTPEVLDFLPHPEGIYAFWDWEHGVTSGTWTDRVNGTVLEAINENNFVVKNSCAQLENKNSDNVYDAKLPIKNLNEATIYIVLNNLFDGKYLADNNGQYIRLGDGYNKYFYYKKSGEADRNFWDFPKQDIENGLIFIMRISQTNYNFSLLYNTIDYDTNTSNPLPRTAFEFSGDFGLCDTLPIKALLISSDISNVDNTKENAKALLDKYFPAQGGI